MHHDKEEDFTVLLMENHFLLLNNLIVMFSVVFHALEKNLLGLKAYPSFYSSLLPRIL